MATEQPDDQRWKAKYRTLLDEQAANDEHADHLRQALIRLSHIVDGASEELDDLLHELRHKVRFGGSSEELQELIAQIDSACANLPHDQQIVANDDSAAKPEQKSVELASELAAQKTEEQRPKAAEPAFTSISERVEGVLIDMVSGLKVPDSVAESKQRIEKTLQHGLNWYELIATLEELSLIIAGTLYEGEKDYAGFLQQTIGELASLHELVMACQQAEHQQSVQGKALEQSISGVLKDLGESLHDTDIEKMKSAVQQGLNDIAGNMQEFNSAQERSALELQENVHALTTQVLQLQQEVAQAQKQIDQHKQQATTDPLTKLPNRAAYDTRLKLEYQRWIRYQRPLTVAVADIDFFKKINDGFGHLAGDAVLVEVATRIKDSLRKTDFAARYGGEEFVLLLPETDETQAMIALEKLRLSIEQYEYAYEKQSIEVTMSFGLSAYREDDNINMVFARADQALYAAKQQGRNRCVIANQ
ncbi:MAG: GGDEF domain-containing protein [Pseudomonadales bacterium]